MPKQIFVNSRTGEEKEFEVDSDGKPILSKDTLFGQKEGTKPTISAPTFADKIFHGIPIKLGPIDTSIGTRDVAPTLQAIGGQAGSVLGPLGRTAGNIGGYGVGLGLRGVAPSYFGTVGSLPEESARLIGGTVLDHLTTFGGKTLSAGLFPSVRNKYMQELIQKIFPMRGINAEMKAAIAADPNLKLTMGQINPLARDVEHTFAAGTKQDLVQAEKDRLISQVQAYKGNKEDLVKAAQVSARSEAAYLKRTGRKLYQDFEPAIESPFNAKKVQRKIPETPVLGPDGRPIIVGGKTLMNPARFEDVNIKGAIELKKSKQFVDNVLPIIKEELGPNDVNSKTIGTTSGAHLMRLRDELSKIGSIETFLDPKTKKPTATYGEFRQLKRIRDSLNRFTRSSEFEPLKDQLQGPLSHLETVLRDDIEEGVKKWGPNSYGKFRAAQQHWAETADKLNPEMAGALLRAGKDPETTYHQVADSMLSDPQKTRQFREIAGRNETADIFKAKLADESLNTVDGLTPEKALRYLETNDAVAREAIPSNELTNAKMFLRRAQVLGPTTEGVNTSLKWKAGGAVLGLGTALGTGLFTGSVPAGLAAGSGLTLALMGAGHKFTKDVLFNPKMARIAMGLLSADPESSTAKWGTRAIIGALKGTQVMITAPDGNKYPANITDDGKINFPKNQPN